MKKLHLAVEHLKRNIEEVAAELQSLPQGRLGKRKTSYSHIIGKKEVGISFDEALIKQLCRKRYLIAHLAQLQNNLAQTQALDLRQPAELVADLPSTYQGLPLHYFYHPSVECFLKDRFLKNTYPSSSLNYVSKGMNVVRSKSELLIANLLEEYGLPYQYDVGLKLGRIWKYPDFIIKEPFSGKLFIWEHFGALNQEGYQQAMNEKMGLYLKHGYVPFENLIYTFEADVASLKRLNYLVEKLILGQ